MISLEDMPMPESVLALLFRVARCLGVEDGENSLSFEGLTLAVADWEKAEIGLQEPVDGLGRDLPTVGKLDEVAGERQRQAKRSYLRARNIERQALYQASSDLLATCAKVPDERITPQFVARRVLGSGVWFDPPPTAKDWFGQLMAEYKRGEVELVGSGDRPTAYDRARKLLELLKFPVQLT